MVVALLIIAAVGILLAAIKQILTSHHLPRTFTLYVLVFVVITEEILARKIPKIAKDTELEKFNSTPFLQFPDPKNIFSRYQ